MNFANLCPGCMREIKSKSENKCPHCGFDTSTYKQNTRCLPINTILAGKYLIGKVLGEGGFGITYIGFDLNMEVPVAIKEYFPVELVSRDTTTMHGDRVLSMSGEKSVTYKEGLKKYVAEAQNVSKFANMPGVVSVKDFFYENDTAYIVMEYIDGISLKEYLKQKNGKLTESETLTLIQPVLEALEQIHASGIVHRDISPDNIMLTFKPNGSVDSVKLIDFGAARMTEKNDQHSLTIILKHGYAPEEQYRTRGEQGPWTDVYAICATMYRMLTGMTPEPAMDRIFQDKLKRPSEFGISVSKTVEEALMEGLAVKKEDRIPSIAELWDALSGTRKRAGAGKMSGKAGNQRLRVGIGAAVLICAAGLGIFFGSTRRTEQTSKNAVLEQTEQNLSAEGQSSENDELNAEMNMAESGGAEVPLEMETETSEEWEVIVTAEPQYSCDGGTNHTVFLQDDGTVISKGSNTYGQRNLAEWERIAAVAAGETFTAGLRENGTVIVAGQLTGKDEVERWENIVQIAASDTHLLGLTGDGKILGNMGYNGKDYSYLEWEKVKAIAAGQYVMAALTEEGQILSLGYREPAQISGWESVSAIVCNQHDVFGRKEDGTIIMHRMWEEGASLYENLEHFQNMKQIRAMNFTLYGADEEGNVHHTGVEWGWGTEAQWEEAGSWKGVKGIAATLSGSHVAADTENGLSKASGNCGNSSLENAKDLEWIKVLPNRYRGEYVVGKKKDGTMLTYGSFTRVSEVPENTEIIEALSYWFEEDFMEESLFAWVTEDGELWMLKDWRFVPVLSNVLDLIGSSIVIDNPYCAALTEEGRVEILSASTPEVLPEGLCEAENWTGIRQIAGCIGRYQTGIVLGLQEDGTVISAAMPDDPHVMNGDWTDIASLHSGTYAVGAIRKDGTAQFLEDEPQYNFGQYNTAGWTDLTQLALGLFHTAGLREDGTVYAAGRNDSGQCEVEDWTDVVYITAGENCTLGIQADGTLLIAGEI